MATITAGDARAPGLLRKVSNVVLDHFGYIPRAAGTTVQQETILDQPLFQRYATGSSVMGLPPGKDVQAQIDAYRSWIFSCIRVISYRVAGLPLMLMLNERVSAEAAGSDEGKAGLWRPRFWRGKGRVKATTSGDLVISEIQKTELDQHAFLDMMRRPNPFMTRMELWLTTINHLLLSGNAYWIVLRDRLRTPREIWPLMPQYMRVLPHQTEYLVGYVYTAVTPPLTFVLDDPEYRIVHFKLPSPKSPYYGMGPVEAQAYATDVDLYTEIYERNFFVEGARPDFVLESKEPVSKEEAELTWQLWEERHKGVARAFRPAILGSGMVAKPLSVSNRDLAFAAIADWSRDKILGAFGVPAAKLGLVVDVNRANADAADLTFNREAVKPLTMLIEERVEADILPEYPGQDATAWLSADFENPVPEDRETRLRERETYLRTGKNTINEFREEDGEDPVPWGDVPLMPGGIMPLGSDLDEEEPEASPTPTPPAEEPEKPTEEPEKPEEEPEEPEDETSQDAYARKTRLWESFVRRVQPREAKLQKQCAKIFRRQERKVLAKLTDVVPKMLMYFTGWSAKKVNGTLATMARAYAGADAPGDAREPLVTGGVVTPQQRVPDFIMEILHVIDEDNATWTELLTDTMREIIDEEGKATVAEIGVGVWDITDPGVLSWIERNGAEKVVGIQNTTKRAIRDQLLDGVANNEGLNELSQRVRSVFAAADQVRALRIARTETHTAANYGIEEGWRQSGVVEEKEWLSARDEVVRDTHIQADGQRVPLDADFVVGEGQGPAPGQIGRAEEDINCRCTMTAVTSEKMRAARRTRTRQTA